MVKKDFSTRTTRPRFGHLPEVVRRIARAFIVANANDPLGWDSNHRRPKVIGLFIFGIDRDPEFFHRQSINLGQQFPGKLNCIALEIISKTEVTQHFEERMVAGGVAHVLKIIMFATGTHAALCRGCSTIGSLLTAQKNVLELDHSGVGEQKRRIIDGHQRTRGHNRVPFRLEELEKGGSYVSGLHRHSNAWLNLAAGGMPANEQTVYFHPRGRDRQSETHFPPPPVIPLTLCNRLSSAPSTPKRRLNP